MLTLLLALAVSSQATVADEEASPPPPPPAALAPADQPVSAPEAAPRRAVTPPAPLPQLDPPAPVYVPMETKRSARLLPEEPRVGAGALVGRVATAIALGFVGELTGELAALGLVVAGYATGSTGVVVGLSIFGVLVRVGFAALGVAIGSALFGNNFGADLRAAMPVAAISVASAVIVGLVLSLLLPYVSPVILTGLPLLAAAIATPLIVQARKSDVGATVMKDALPMSGAVVSF